MATLYRHEGSYRTRTGGDAVNTDPVLWYFASYRSGPLNYTPFHCPGLRNGRQHR